MATSNNPKIQALMDEVEELDLGDSDLEAKLQLIAQKMAREQRIARAKQEGVDYDDNLTDPAEAFACEGCQ